mmetsp:Transcript_1405/g.1247  ORF Transcript_1405/g.1247 Transcript_1405/m.1247 type:complete len:148 (-) Transcript_1405:19-462(-)
MEVDKVEMERGYNKIESDYISLQEKYANLEKNLALMTKSRDQKDKHLAIINKENERIFKKLEKHETEGVQEKKLYQENKEPNKSNLLGYKSERPVEKKVRKNAPKHLGALSGFNVNSDQPSFSSYSKEKSHKLKEKLKKMKKTEYLY